MLQKSCNFAEIRIIIMEQPISDMTCPPFSEKIRKPNNMVSWLGFGFSLFVLILLWITLIISALIVNNTGTSSGGTYALLTIFCMIGFPLGLVGLVLSIVGVIKAANSGGKKWIGICGLVFTGLSLLSIFIPMAIGIMGTKESEQVVDTVSVGNGVVLLVDGDQLKCYDNREKQDYNPYQTRVEYYFVIEDELEVWFSMHNIERDDSIKVYVSNGTDYTQAHEVLQALKNMRMTKYQVMSDQNDL